MPLVRISLRQGKPAAYRRALAEQVHLAMVDTINIPADDRFQLIHEHGPDDFFYAPEYKGLPHTDDLVFIQITLNAGRSVEVKKKLYARLAERLKENPGLRPEDVIVSLVDVPQENWSFGNGLAPYAP